MHVSKQQVELRSIILAIIVSLLLTLAGCRSDDANRSSKSNELIVGAGADVSVTGAFQAQLGVYPLNANVAEPLFPAYNATKAGELHMARGWALELGRDGIRINCIASFPESYWSRKFYPFVLKNPGHQF